MQSNRIHYFDVAKGFLILMVVLQHMPQVADLYSIHNNTFEIIRISSQSWTGYYMPAFFIITGICSNFTHPFKVFFFKNLKTLMIPCFTLMALCVWIGNILKGSLDIVDYLSVGFTSFFKSGGVYWFITALFIAKILYWFIKNKVSSRLYCYIIMGIIMLLGCLCNNLLAFEPWHLWHALILSPFLLLGDDIGTQFKNPPLHQWKLYWIIGPSLVYIILMILLYVVDIKLPAVTQRIVLNWVEIPLLLLLALSGSYYLMLVSKWINSCKCLEFLGRHTLVIYCLHVFFAQCMFMQFQISLNSNSYLSTLLTVGLIILNVILCCIFSVVLNTKYLNFLIGKF